MKFDPVKVQILGKEFMPSLNEVFSVIRAEEGRRTVMMEATHTEGSAMMITHGRNEIKHDVERIKTEGRKIQKEEQFCNYCKKTGHTKEICWKLHGRPLSRNHITPKRFGVMEDSGGISQEGMHTWPMLKRQPQKLTPER